MRNWYEMYVFGRDRAVELTRGVEAARAAGAAGSAARGRPAIPAVSPVAAASAVTTVVRVEQAKGAARGRATLVLQRDEVVTLPLRGREYRVGCLAGKLWITMDPSPVDHLLVPGMEITLRGKGRAVIQAMRTATVRIDRSSTIHVAARTALRPAIQLG